jgi:hypothetical protein
MNRRRQPTSTTTLPAERLDDAELAGVTRGRDDVQAGVARDVDGGLTERRRPAADHERLAARHGQVAESADPRPLASGH